MTTDTTDTTDTTVTSTEHTARTGRGVLQDRGVKLSLLWVFAVLNYLYCDLLGLMDAALLKQYLTGTVGGVHISEGFLLSAGVLMEIPMAMVVLSIFLPARASRWTNVVAGSIMTLVQIGSLFVGSGLTLYYAGFSAVEVTATAFIVGYAWRWPVHQSS